MDTYQQKTRRIQTQTIQNQKRRAVAVKMPVVCMECDKRFSTTKVIPSCPKCGGADIELADSVTRRNGRV